MNAAPVSEAVSVSARDKRLLWPALLLAVATLALYWPASRYDFVAFDDDNYVYDNPWVTAGLDAATVKWAFTTTFAANWHPLTWLSHLADTSIYGAPAGGPHFTNILLHALNTLLLFLLLARLTASPWPSFAAAALFGWHPLHVESVAWISERKDLLCALFWLLTMGAYLRYAENLKSRCSKFKFHYALALLFFALGLMAKPMIVTLPFALLLLDYWPLQRWGTASLAGLLKEKLPFLVLAGAGCVVTVAAQHAGGAIKSFQEVPFVERVLNVPVAYATYLGKTLWPVNLCALYPLPVKPPVFAAIISVVMLAVITGLAVAGRRRFPWLAVGWFWFLGTLVPVIGFVQVGRQALADRYTYVPSVGLFIMFAWSVNYWLARSPRARTAACGGAALCLLACAAAAERQLPYWRDSRAFFSRILSITPDCALAENGLGLALSKAGHRDEAIALYQAALRLDPGSVITHYNLGTELAGAGKLDEAMSEFSGALKLNPRNEQLHNNVGVVLAREGKIEPALREFQRSIELNPQYPKPYLNSAMSLEKLGRFGEAAANYQKAVQLDAAWPEAFDRFASLLAAGRDSKLRNPALAVKLAGRANELTQSARPDYLRTLAAAYASAGQYSNAVVTAELAGKRAASGGLAALAAKISADLEGYRVGRESPAPAE